MRASPLVGRFRLLLAAFLSLIGLSVPASADTFRDDFNAVSYSNNDGTVSWATDWVERNDDGSPSSGNVVIAGGALVLEDQPNTNTSPSAEREADLSGYVQATLTFDFETAGGVDPDDSVRVEVSDDGGANWTLLENITGIGDTTGSRSYDLLSYIPALTANTRVRFRVSNGNPDGTGGTACCYGGPGEEFRVLNVQIEGFCGAPPVTFRDEFSTVAYNRNDGTVNWATDWLERDDDGSPSGGNVQITGGGELGLDDRPNSGGQPSVEREADLAAYNSITFSFDYRTTGGVDANDSVVVEVSDDGGGSWSPLENFTGIAGATSGSRSYDISAQAASNTRIRFRVNNLYGGPNERFLVDNVQIAASSLGACGPSVSPVGEWRMDEQTWIGAPGDVADSTGNGLDGTAVGAAAPVPAKVCNGASLDGSSQFIRIADDPLLDIQDELTVTAWVNPSLIPSGGNLKTIVSKDENFEFHINSSGQVFWWWNSGTGVENGFAATHTLTTTGTPLTTGQWYHIAIVYSRSQASQKIYIDGVERASDSRSERLAFTTDPLEIGADQGFSGREFSGLIDEVKVFSAALSQTDILAIRNETRPCQLQPLAYYAMDESGWNGTPGEIIDSSGNGNHAVALGGSTTVDPGKVCFGGDIPNNNQDTNPDAINTGLDVDSEVGSVGTINFWYKSDRAWQWQDRQLFDATTDVFGGTSSSNKYFFLVLRANGQLRFALEDSSDSDFILDTPLPGFSFGPNTWVHIAVTWDLPNDRLQTYVDGNLAAEDTSFNSNGNLGDVGDLFLGDNSSTYLVSGATRRSANGVLDEARIYNQVLSEAQIQADRDATHPCVGGLLDHYDIVHSGLGITCEAEPVTIVAQSNNHQPVPADGVTIALSTSTGLGDWALGTGNGTFSNLGNGQATYTFFAESQVILLLAHTTAAVVNVDVSDGVATELSGSAGGPGDTLPIDPDLDFRDSALRFYANNVVNNIGIQISGKPSDTPPGAQILTLKAVETNTDTGECEARLEGVQSVELAFECQDPNTCKGGQSVSISGTGIAGNNAGASPLAYTPVDLDFGIPGTGIATFALSYSDAGRIRLHARKAVLAAPPEPAITLLGTSNEFVVRPFGFHVTVPGNPGALDHTGVAFIRAGETTGDSFQATVTAVRWQSGDDVDDNGIPDGFGDTTLGNNADLSDNGATPNFGNESAPNANIGLSRVHIHPLIVDGGSQGSLSGPAGLLTATDGTATSGALRYSEVGVIEIDAITASYFGSVSIQGGSGAIGRFFPDHFVVGGSPAPSITQRRAIGGCTDSFSYMGEDFDVDFTLEARNADGNFTQNYESAATYDYAYLVIDANPPVGGGELDFGAVDSPGVPGETGLTGRLLQGTVTGGFSDGSALVVGTMRILRDTSEDGPYQDLRIGVNPVDGDGLALRSADLDLDPAVTGTDTHVQLITSDVRFGRLVVRNAFGSELLTLPVPLIAQFYDGTSFQLNTNDNCTPVAASRLDLSNDQQDPPQGTMTIMVGGGTTTGSLSEAALSGGDTSVDYTSPGAGNTGYVDMAVDLTGLDYLLYDWDGIDQLGDADVFDDVPLGRATFGIYRGPPRIIQIRDPRM